MYTFGGYADGYVTDLVAKFDGEWTEMASLLAPRRGHSSVVIGNTIVHIGGSEKWYVFGTVSDALTLRAFFKID